ncbi:nucleotidyltransferase family protein [Neorhizobium sp. T25_13]|uniref:nucleotidyltransferase family protein n=1 Tax=Neorhizobium sp. T25_13 TaxID=2093830 RepID=UPI000CF848B6|nr:nucleotidyltransferase family protein [Neorhizobium sp. T25_13]
MSLTEQQFFESVRRNPINGEVLSRLRPLQIPQGILTAGCLVQTVWNLKSGYDPQYGIKDYDVFYFDDSDLSWDAEDAVIRRVQQAVADLPAKVEVKNQARVHLWYREKFEAEYPALKKAEDGIDRYLTLCTRVGIRLSDYSLYAPDGLEDMWNGILRLNPLNPQRKLYQIKCMEYLKRWPWLTIIDGQTEDCNAL